MTSGALRILSLAALLLTFSLTGSAEPSDSTVIFFPAYRLFPILTADGTGHQFSIAKDVRSHLWFGSAGAQPRIVEIHLGDATSQLSVAGTVHTTLERGQGGGNVVTIDYFVDFLIDLQIVGGLVLRTGYGHHSAHFADDWIDRTGVQAVNYVKEYFPLLGAYRIPAIGGFVYAGARFDHHSLPESGQQWVLQCGTEVGNVPLFAGMRAYGAIDLKFKSEVEWGATQSYQIGIKLFERSGSCLRTACTYRTGIDDRGQFYKERIDLGLVGVYVDF